MRLDPRNKTHVSGSSYAWFIFNLNTKQCYSQITHNTHICTDIQHTTILICPLLYDLTLLFTYLENQLLCSWCEYPSTLVPGSLSTVLPLLLHPPQGTPQIKLHIYIDDISNVSRSVWHNPPPPLPLSPRRGLFTVCPYYTVYSAVTPRLRNCLGLPPISFRLVRCGFKLGIGELRCGS
jgi:hypothetical protein